MSREKEFDVEQISGHQFMDEEDKGYFEKFGFAMSDQAELLADQYDIDSETMSNSFDFLMDSLIYRTNEYIVNGAPLNCSLQTSIVQKLTYQDNDIVSEPMGIEEMSTLQLPENRQESVNGLAFANVEDVKGGMRDEKEAIENETDNVNIVSFGNCKWIEQEQIKKVEDLAKKLYRNLVEVNSEITITEIEEKMKTAIEQGKGTCYCCMLLNPEWENLPVEYDYMTNAFHPELPTAGVSKILESESYMQFNGKEGINMMSMLFCKRGGIISAKESGQNKYQFENLSDEEILFVTTIYGEAAACSEIAWQAIANVIMNRVGVRDWKKYKTPTEVIMYSGFDAYTNPNEPYKEAENYFNNRDYTNVKIEQMIEIIIPIYRGQTEDITNGATLYYSPEAQKYLHAKYPQLYPEKPSWNFSQLEEVKIEGLENDDLKFYKYK